MNVDTRGGELGAAGLRICLLGVGYCAYMMFIHGVHMLCIHAVHMVCTYDVHVVNMASIQCLFGVYTCCVYDMSMWCLCGVYI